LQKRVITTGAHRVLGVFLSECAIVFFESNRVYSLQKRGNEMVTAIIAVIIISLVTVFSVQNAAPVVLSFMFWRFEASLAIVVFLSSFSGIIIGAIVSTLMRAKTKKKTEIRSKGEQGGSSQEW